MHLAVALIEQVGATEEYLNYLKNSNRLRTFQTQVANYMQLPDGKDEVDINRGHFERTLSSSDCFYNMHVRLLTTNFCYHPHIQYALWVWAGVCESRSSEITMAAVLTRVKPNCFVFLHQILKQTQLHESDPRTQYECFKTAASDFGLSRSEFEAVENLLMHISGPCRDKLAKMASSWGMIKGPITHGGVASKALRTAYMVDTDVDFYQDKLGNTEATVQLILERVHRDFVRVATGMRSSATDERIHYLQKACRMFQLYCENLRTKLKPEARKLKP